MKATLNLDGVFVAVCTPFSSDGSVDVNAFVAHLESLALAKVQGFVVCGTTGEAATLTDTERKIVLEKALQVAKKHDLVAIAGCGSNDTAATLKSIQEASRLGYAAALVVTPYYNKPTPSGLAKHYEQLAERGGLPIILYNVPSRTGVNLSPELTVKLMELPQIVGIKEATGNYSQWMTLAQSDCWKEKALLAGDDDAFATILALGGKGVISATANVAPKPFVELFQAARSGNWEKAFRLQKDLFPLIRAMFLETNPGPLKFALNRSKKHPAYPPFLRLPLVAVESSTEEKITDVFEKWKATFDL